jgi:hypothetical protein
MLTPLHFWSSEIGKNSIVLVRVMVAFIIIVLGGVQVLPLGVCAWFAIMISLMMVGVAPAAAA